MQKSFSPIITTALCLFLLSCKPETSTHYRGSEQFAGPPPDNKLLWSKIVDGKVTTVPIMWKKDLFMLFGTSAGTLYNFDYRKGNFKWQNKYSAPVSSSPSLYDEKAFFGLENGNFFGVELETGKQLWKFEAKRRAGSCARSRG